MKLAIAAVAAGLLLTGCATSPTSIAPSYVSPTAYEAMSCKQLTEEAQRVSSRAAAATGVQNQRATTDAVAMGVGLVLFWPALFFIGGDKRNTAELASLKCQMAAIEEVNRTKNCGIQFAAT